MSRPSSRATRVSPAKSGVLFSHQQRHQDTTFSTFESTVSPDHHHYVDAEEEELIRRHRQRERPTTSTTSIVDRFQGLPDDRLRMITRALSNAGTSYIEEASHTQGTASFFEHTVDRALLPLLDPKSASRSVGRSFSLVDLEESDLVGLIGNMKMVIASQREEIHCLRMTVQELVVEIADGHDLHKSSTIPEVIQVEEDSSSEVVVDQQIFRSRNRSATTSSASRSKPDDYSYILSSIAHSRSIDSDSHIEPEGRYMPEERSGYRKVRKKKDPPSRGGDLKSVRRFISWEDEDSEDSMAEVDESLLNRSSGDKQQSVHGEVGGPSGDDSADKAKAESQATSPTRNYAKHIVQERRRRYQSFRRSREMTESKRKKEALLKAKHSIKRADAIAMDDRGGGGTNAGSTGNLDGVGYQPVSTVPVAHVRFREDELTLMETKAAPTTESEI